MKAREPWPTDRNPVAVCVGMKLHKTPYVNLSAFLYLYTIIRAHRHAIWTHFIKLKFDLGCQTYECMRDVVSFIMGVDYCNCSFISTL